MNPTFATFMASANRLIARSSTGQRLLRTLPHTGDPDAPSDIDTRNEVDPAGVGMSKAAVETIWRATTALYATGYYPAIMLCLRRRGRVLINRAIGHASGFESGAMPAARMPATVATPACLYSVSKAITAIVVHHLADQGTIDLLDPVCRYVPEFAAHGKNRLTIHHVLTHRGGVPAIPLDAPPSIITDHRRMLELICAARPLDAHGGIQAYHAVTGGTILREVLERATGQSLRSYWLRHFKTPMRFRFLDYGANPETFALMARDHLCGARLPPRLGRYLKTCVGLDFDGDGHRLNNYDFFAQPVAAGNMVATAEELGRFFQMLLDDGCVAGRRIVAPSTVRRATTENTPHRFDTVLKLPMRFSAGMMLGGAPFGLFGRHTGHAFGHIGFVNIAGWADPERDLSVGLITTGKPLLAHNLIFFGLLLGTISRHVPRDGGDERHALSCADRSRR